MPGMNSAGQHPLDKAGVVELLQRYGIMPTQQRIDIAHYVFQRAQHLSAEAILAGVNAKRERVSKATVYNTLSLFLGKSLLSEVVVDPGKLFYDSTTEPHHHIYDIESGELIDIENARVSVSGLPPLPEGKEVAGINAVVRIRTRS